MTERMLRAMMVEHDVSHDFVNIVTSFYQRIVNVEESYCAPFQKYDSVAYVGNAPCVQYNDLPAE